MKSKFAAALFITMGLALMFALVRMRHSNAHIRNAPPEDALIVQKVPPLPSGVSELKFSEFFVTPIGDRGLALTDKLASLDGKRVRMLGYMVRQEGGLPGKFLFSAIPVQLHDHDSALADDLPPAVVRVSVPTCQDREVPFAPGLMLLTGTLSVGPHDEADGRISLVRLTLDPPARGESKNPSFTGDVAGLASSHRSLAR